MTAAGGKLACARSIAWALSGLVVSIPVAAAEGRQKEPVAVVAELVASPQEAGEGLQFLQADSKGRLALLRTHPLSVARLLPSGRLQETHRPVLLASGRETLPVFEAARSASGERWLLRLVNHEVRLIENEQEIPLPPLGWMPSAVAFVRDEPWVALLPMTLAAEVEGIKPSSAGRFPAIVRLAGRQWQIVREEETPTTISLAPGGVGMLARAAADVRLFGGRDGVLWVAYQHRYRILGIDWKGKKVAEIRVGKGEPKIVPLSEAEREAFREEAAAEGFAVKPSSLPQLRAERVFSGLGDDGSGNLYLIARSHGEKGSSELELHRWNRVEGKLERAKLRGVSSEGRFTIAAAADGLYLSDTLQGSGIWRIPWEALEAASWVPVENTTIE